MVLLGEFAFYLLIEVLMYQLGRVMIPLISLGRARALRPREILRKDLAAHAQDGKMLLPPWAASIAGILTLGSAIIVYASLH